MAAYSLESKEARKERECVLFRSLKDPLRSLFSSSYLKDDDAECGRKEER